QPLLEFWSHAAFCSDMTEANTTGTDAKVEVTAPELPERAKDLRAPLNVEAMLCGAGLRPTRQRVVLTQLLFGQGDRHLTAEMLHRNAAQLGHKISLATVYNTLNLFAKMEMLREIGIQGSTTYFDTRTSDHHHFFIEGADEIRDIPMTQ